MSTNHSTARQSRSKPPKPYPDFPLFPHATGRWAKKIRGRLYYFGPWDDWQAAKAEYDRVKDDLYAGRTPPPKDDGRLTVKQLCNRFLAWKAQQVDRGDITPRMRRDYRYMTDRVMRVFGGERAVADLKPADFERLAADMAHLAPATRKAEIQKTRVLFNYAYKSELIDRPLRYGPAFAPPSKTIIKKARKGNGLKMFEAGEIRAMLEAASVPFRAMLLLGINCGFGNNDCATLTIDALDLEGGWHHHPRPKTGVERRCPLWPETVEALKMALSERPRPNGKAHANLVFLTQKGNPWVRFDGRNWSDAVTGACRLLLRKLGIKRPGVNFYALRHTFATIGGAARDQVAVDFLMGHADQTMASHYRERIDDDRLRRVTDHVHDWLFSSDKAQ